MWHLARSGKELGGAEGKRCWSYAMQAGTGGSSAAAHTPAKLPLLRGALQAVGELKNALTV